MMKKKSVMPDENKSERIYSLNGCSLGKSDTEL
jgi:hypothetical protein